MRRTLAFLAMLGTLTALGGCAMPPVLVVASYSADVVSYAATGKTVTDHAYSAIARSDCSFIRILQRKPICIDTPPEAKPDQQVASVPEAASPETAPPAPSTAPDRYVVIGSFLKTRHAEAARARYASFHPAIVAATVHGKHFHRVVAGPLSEPDAERLKDSLVAAAPQLRPPRG